ncbi:hypothetical protein D3C72_349380 [compost metagenome]
MNSRVRVVSQAVIRDVTDSVGHVVIHRRDHRRLRWGDIRGIDRRRWPGIARVIRRIGGQLLAVKLQRGDSDGKVAVIARRGVTNLHAIRTFNADGAARFGGAGNGGPVIRDIQVIRCQRFGGVRRISVTWLAVIPRWIAGDHLQHFAVGLWRIDRYGEMAVSICGAGTDHAASRIFNGDGAVWLGATADAGSVSGDGQSGWRVRSDVVKGDSCSRNTGVPGGVRGDDRNGLAVGLRRAERNGEVAAAICRACPALTRAVGNGNGAVRFSSTGYLGACRVEGDRRLAWCYGIDNKVDGLRQAARIPGSVDFTHRDRVRAFGKWAIRSHTPQAVRADGHSADFHAVIVNNNRAARIAPTGQTRLAGIGGLARGNRTADRADFIIDHKSGRRSGRGDINGNVKARRGSAGIARHVCGAHRNLVAAFTQID